VKKKLDHCAIFLYLVDDKSKLLLKIQGSMETKCRMVAYPLSNHGAFTALFLMRIIRVRKPTGIAHRRKQTDFMPFLSIGLT
jgi:hypothetical protein